MGNIKKIHLVYLWVFKADYANIIYLWGTMPILFTCGGLCQYYLLVADYANIIYLWGGVKGAMSPYLL